MTIHITEHEPSTNGSGATREGDAADIFSDLAALKLSPDEAGQIGTEEVLAHISVRKPSKTEFVWVHPDPAMSLATSIFVDHEGDIYFVAPAARNLLVAGVKAMLLVATVNQRGLFFLWPIGLGDGTGRRNAFHDTARKGSELAKHEWTKVIPDMAAGYYRLFKALGELPKPVFPEKPFEELLRIAFRGRIIDNENHTVVKQAVGLIP
jgi:hypothetical protein